KGSDALLENCPELGDQRILFFQDLRCQRPNVGGHVGIVLPDEFQPATRQRNESVIQALAVKVIERLRRKGRIGGRAAQQQVQFGKAPSHGCGERKIRIDQLGRKRWRIGQDKAQRVNVRGRRFL